MRGGWRWEYKMSKERARALGIAEAAEMLSISPRSLGDKRFRVRVGLQGRHIGSRLVFLETDLIKLLECRRESLPGARR